jgi:hypothetical protein
MENPENNEYVNEFNLLLLNMNEDALTEEENDICEECHIPMDLVVDNYVCSKCGIMHFARMEGADAGEDNAISPNSPLTVKAVGGDSAKIRRRLYKWTANKKNAQSKKIGSVLNVMNSPSKGYSQKILKIALEWYVAIRSNPNAPIFRGNVLKGILIGLIYYACIRCDITQKPKELTKLLNIKSSYISAGNKILLTFHNSGLIVLPINENPKEAFTERFVNRLCLESKDELFKKLVLVVVDEMIRLKISLTTTTSTNISGTIWWLLNEYHIPLKETKNRRKFVSECCGGTSITTFIKYAELIEKYKNFITPIINKNGGEKLISIHS